MDENSNTCIRPATGDRYNIKIDAEIIQLRKKEEYDKSNRKYIVFACAFMIHFMMDGFSAMISVMFVDIVRTFNASHSEASLMQSLVRGCMYGGGTVGELLIRKLGFTKCVVTGCLLVSVSLLASSFATNITAIVILVGVGAGCGLTLPLLSTFIAIGRAFDSVSFPKYMAYAIAGGGVGAITMPYVAESILEEYGWRGLCILMSAILANLVVFAAGIHFNLPKYKETAPHKKKPLFDISILRNPMYMTFLMIVIPYGLTGFIESWYIPDYMVTIGYSREQGSFLLTVIGASSAFGRIMAGAVNPVCKYTKTAIIFHWTYLFLILAAAHAMFPMFPSYSTLFVASILYGTCFGIIVSQCSPVIYEAVGNDKFAVAQGLDNTIYGIFSSVGGVVAGSITDTTGSYEMVFYMAAISSVFCSLCGFIFLISVSIRKLFDRKLSHILETTHL